MEIQGKPVRMQIGSGTSCNVLPKKYPENKQVNDRLQQAANPSTWNGKTEHA